MRFEINNISRKAHKIGKKLYQVNNSNWVKDLTSSIGNFNKDFNMNPNIDSKNLKNLNKTHNRFRKNGKKHRRVR